MIGMNIWKEKIERRQMNKKKLRKAVLFYYKISYVLVGSLVLFFVIKTLLIVYAIIIYIFAEAGKNTIIPTINSYVKRNTVYIILFLVMTIIYFPFKKDNQTPTKNRGGLQPKEAEVN